ncbi:MAG: hypothetical protein NZ990_06055 [Myxococcota bacterium]|nr:hypothetical protein [Myxococcota bacterium]
MSELDQALDQFYPCGPEFEGGLSNHGPMVAEALHALGHDALIAAWVDVYWPRLEEWEPAAPIPADERELALGSGDFGRWLTTFLPWVEAEPWQPCVREWLPQLLPGFFSAAAHGPIRVAHAVRALEEEDNPTRRRELAAALAYWASSFRTLPGEPAVAPSSGKSPGVLLAEARLVPQRRRRQGFLVDAVAVLDDDPDFARSMGEADLEQHTPGELIGEICVAAAGLYLAHPEARIAYIHALTGPAALRRMAGYLDSTQLRRGIGYALQATAALHVTHGQFPGAQEADPALQDLASSWDELRYRAACSLEEHVIKLTEACWSEDRIRSDWRFRFAAADAVTHLGFSRGGRGG